MPSRGEGCSRVIAVAWSTNQPRSPVITAAHCGSSASPSTATGASRSPRRGVGHRCSFSTRPSPWPPVIAPAGSVAATPTAATATRSAPAVGSRRPLTAVELNGRLASERLRRGRGVDRGGDRRLWTAELDTLPVGTVIIGDDHHPHLVLGDHTRRFSFDGWVEPTERRGHTRVTVLTPPTSVAALRLGYAPVLHPSASYSWRSAIT